MSIKERLLELFYQTDGNYLSGEAIADTLKVSRTAIWKAVESLRQDGYIIDAIRNKGYALSLDTDIVSAQGIHKYLAPLCNIAQIKVFPSVTSTNTVAREEASNGAKNGTVIIANSQTAGKGRNGHTFCSPIDTGLYMSIILRPDLFPASQAIRFTTMAAVAACEAIEAVSDRKAQIKWVNDIFIDGKKVSGILTEASMGMENGFLEYAVLGIGINVYTPKEGFPTEIKNIATSVFEKKVRDGKNRIAAEFINNFMSLQTSNIDYIQNYRSRSFVIGKEIDVIKPSCTKKATAIDIDDECRLIVKYLNGTTEALSSGEISIKPISI